MKHIVDKDKLITNYNTYKELGTVYFPIKANDKEEIIDTIGELNNNRFLISNINHAYKLHNKIERCIAINTLLGLEEYVELYMTGVKSFVFDNCTKMKQFLSIMDSKDVEITIKLSLSSIVDIPTNTGANISQQHEMEKYLRDNNYTFGYSIYINKEAKKHINIDDCIRFLHLNINLSKPKFISIGGISDLDKKCKVSIIEFKKYITNQGVELRVEPGEALVNDAVYTLCNIIAIHTNRDSISITIDSSTYVEFYDIVALNRQFEFEYIQTSDNKIKIYKRKRKNTLSIHIFGNSSDSNDYIGHFYVEDKKQFNIGDSIKVNNTGAYFGRYKLI